MPGRVVFNGQEYEGIEAMPPAVRAAYFLDAHREAKRAAAGILPWLLAVVAVGILAFGIWTLRSLTGSAPAGGVGLPIHPIFVALVAVTAVAGIAMVVWMRLHPEGAAGALGALERIGRVAARALQIALAVAAGGVAAGGYWMITTMDPGSRSQGGVVFIGVGVVVALACIVGMYVAVERGLRRDD